MEFDDTGELTYYEFPKRLFKYSTINDNFISALTAGKLWFSPPRYFDDPFDCHPRIETKVTPKEAFQYYEISGGKIIGPEHYVQILDWAWKSSLDPTELNQIITEECQNIIDQKGICCFSERHDVDKMWSLYANSYSGLCIEYDTQKLLPHLTGKQPYQNVPLTMIKVEYSDNLNKFNYVKERVKHRNTGEFKHKIDKNFLGTKATSWSEQKEIRLITPSFGLKPINMNAINSITFGSKASKENIEMTKNIILERNLAHVGFKMVELNYLKRSIEVVPH